MEDREEKIRARAHAIWEAEGKPHGHDRLHWDQAIADIDGETPADEAETAAESAIEVVESAKKRRGKS